jgi:acylglycerol lipase
MIEMSFQNNAGDSIFVRRWSPACEARGAIVVVPGFNSHGGYYSWVAQKLAALDLLVYAVDLRGRGKSGGERFFVNSFDDYVNDVEVLVSSVKSGAPDLPIFMLGHSAGGVVACLYALEHPGDLCGLICESFAYQLPASGFALTALKGLSHIAPHAHVLKLKNLDFSRDPAIVEAMNADQLIAGESQSSRTIAAMIKADERLKAQFSSITLPVLILHGTADKAAKESGSESFYDSVGSPDRTLKLYEDHVHDLLNDRGKESVMADIEDWLSARVGKAEPRRVSSRMASRNASQNLTRGSSGLGLPGGKMPMVGKLLTCRAHVPLRFVRRSVVMKLYWSEIKS